jgi:protein-tyrosine phosphatase
MYRSGKIVLLGILVLAFVAGVYGYFRFAYGYHKRLRTVEPGRFYRSGQMTAAGFTDTVRQLGIRMIINVQDDYPDPDLQLHFLTSDTIKESELCRQLGVQYVWLAPDLQPRDTPGGPRPKAIADFLALMDDPANYPVLLHCKAGLHRTGVLTAVWRMEYQGWSHAAAYRELKAHGFGEWAGTAANEYVAQYVLEYQPRRARPATALGRAD